MERVHKIISNSRFRNLIEKLNFFEKDRKYCGHGLTHCFDVARIAYIISLEEKLTINKDIIYAASLLHDLGRVTQYESNIPHNIAGAEIAANILKECDFDNNEIIIITDAILCHRKYLSRKKDDIASLLYKADKLSRLCFECISSDTCNWSEEKKNKKIIY